MHRMHRAAALAALTFLAACQDRGSTPVSAVERRATPAAAEGYATPGELREGYILGRDGKPHRIVYEVQGGHAIWQGDIDLGPASSIPTEPQSVRTDGPRMGVTIDASPGSRRWVNAVVPYVIDATLPSPSRVTDAIAAIEAATGTVDFVPRTTQTDYVRVSPGSGCSSYVGRQGGVQVVTLASGCSTGNAQHELLHALGMGHEQSRCDRNSYVQILYGNIDPDRVHNFDQLCDGYTDVFGYDEGSIMHYGPYDFTANGQKTIQSLRGLESLMGQRSALSSTDISTVDWMYPPPPPPPPTISSATTNPSPAKQYLSFTVTVNGSNFDPSNVQLHLLNATGSSCPDPGCVVNLSSKTSTQLVGSIALSLAGTYTVRARNGTSSWASGPTITVAPMYP